MASRMFLRTSSSVALWPKRPRSSVTDAMKPLPGAFPMTTAQVRGIGPQRAAAALRFAPEPNRRYARSFPRSARAMMSLWISFVPS